MLLDEAKAEREMIAIDADRLEVVCLCFGDSPFALADIALEAVFNLLRAVAADAVEHLDAAGTATYRARLLVLYPGALAALARAGTPDREVYGLV